MIFDGCLLQNDSLYARRIENILEFVSCDYKIQNKQFSHHMPALHGFEVPVFKVKLVEHLFPIYVFLHGSLVAFSSDCSHHNGRNKIPKFFF